MRNFCKSDQHVGKSTSLNELINNTMFIKKTVKISLKNWLLDVGRSLARGRCY